jgi:hypothetical protein
MYVLEEITDGEKFIGLRISTNGRMVAELKGGVALTIAAQHAALPFNGKKDAYLSDIVMAVTHCAITGSVPVAMVG